MINKIIININNFNVLARLTKGEIPILAELLRKTNEDGEYRGLIILNASIRKNIISSLEIQSASFNNSLNALTKKGFLTRIDTNIYKPNTNLFELQ